jgi:hypothetical protein
VRARATLADEPEDLVGEERELALDRAISHSLYLRSIV